ncbi:glycosyltransferase [Conexibacter sp. SYSU D00693]|uniref:glycosyltransferase n=1 Tax=Conexibacter sp. SYSU D00693 TaxID=2812560 RepID=UPI00196B13A1|nr:glycosyltransferase [Conexibacter sp. SYSU D00693]
MILLLHNRYRHLGGEERAVRDTQWLVREHLGEDCEVLERDSAALGRARAATALVRGGLEPEDVAAAVRHTGARVLHAHNTNPAFGWRALAAAREAGARVVLHLHNYRLVCAVGTCVNSRGQDCTRCQGRDTLPGIALRCRGGAAEAVAYGVALAAHQRRLVAQADALVVPSDAARHRLRALRAPLGETPVHVVPHALRAFAAKSRAHEGEHALIASRLAPEKGITTAVAAAQAAGLPVVVAGAGPLEAQLRAAAPDATFTGWVDERRLAELRARARVSVIASQAAETFGLAALEAMADGVPVAATATGALRELAPAAALAPVGDADALARAIREVAGDPGRGAASIAAARARCAPAVVAPRLAAVYDALA